MTLSHSVLKDVRCGYLYANKKLVLVHETAHRKAGKVEWVTIHDTALECHFDGRLVLHRRGFVRMLAHALRVEAKEPTLQGGSDNTRKLNLAVGYVAVRFGPDFYHDSVMIPLLEALSGDVTMQPERVWEEPEDGRWGGFTVAKGAK